MDYTCRRRPCKRQRVVIALSVEKNSAILRGVTFYRRSIARRPPAPPPLTLPQTQLHLPAIPLLPQYSQTPLKIISNCSHLILTCIPITIHLSSNKCPISTPQLFPHPTQRHSHIFQKVLANTFLLFTRSAAKY
ncbi:unnamed protein product [Klebsiella pneumoniae]|nr:unnamed protein product [Klebsiella pneumoniae]